MHLPSSSPALSMEIRVVFRVPLVTTLKAEQAYGTLPDALLQGGVCCLLLLATWILALTLAALTSSEGGTGAFYSCRTASGMRPPLLPSIPLPAFPLSSGYRTLSRGLATGVLCYWVRHSPRATKVKKILQIIL